VRNISGSAVDFNLSDPYPVNFVVSDSRGRPVWSSIPAGTVMEPLAEINQSIHPHGQRVLLSSWDQRSPGGNLIPTGVYSVIALVQLSASRPLSLGPRELRVEP